jgi:hypothetical protein
MKDQRMSDVDRREFLSIIAMAFCAALATALLPEIPPVDDVEVAGDEDFWIGGY